MFAWTVKCKPKLGFGIAGIEGILGIEIVGNLNEGSLNDGNGRWGYDNFGTENLGILNDGNLSSVFNDKFKLVEIDGSEILGILTLGIDTLAPDIFPMLGIDIEGIEIFGNEGTLIDNFNTFKFGSFGIVGSFGSVNFGRFKGGSDIFGIAMEIQIWGIATLRCNVFSIKSNNNCNGDAVKFVYKFFSCSKSVNSGIFKVGNNGSGNVESNGSPRTASATATKFIITPISAVSTEIPFCDWSKIWLIIPNANVSKKAPKLGIVGSDNVPTLMICAIWLTRPNKVLINAAK